MKNLHITFEKVAQMLQKVSLDPNFKLKIYDLIERDDLPEVNIINEDWVKIKVKLGGICGTDLNLLT